MRIARWDRLGTHCRGETLKRRQRASAAEPFCSDQVRLSGHYGLFRRRAAGVHDLRGRRPKACKCSAEKLKVQSCWPLGLLILPHVKNWNLQKIGPGFCGAYCFVRRVKTGRRRGGVYGSPVGLACDEVTVVPLFN
jgi:hypothetical protein